MKSNLLINEPPLQVLPSLAVAIGLNEAIIIQQLHYWLENSKAGIERNGFKWVFNTYEEWHENFPFWSVSTIQRIFASLEEKRIVIAEQLDKHKHDMHKFYRIDYTELRMVDHVNLESSDHSNLESSSTPSCYDVNKNTETTTETTTEKNKPIILGIESAIFSGRPVTQSDLDPQGNNPRQAIIDRMHKLLGPNFKPYGESPEFDRVVRFVQEREVSGESLDTFAAWAKRQKGYDPRWYYRKPDNIKSEWSLAFPAPKQAEESQDSPDFQRRLAIAATLVQQPIGAD
jgi:hypothetical protein